MAVNQPLSARSSESILNPFKTGGANTDANGAANEENPSTPRHSNKMFKVIPTPGQAASNQPLTKLTPTPKANPETLAKPGKATPTLFPMTPTLELKTPPTTLAEPGPTASNDISTATKLRHEASQLKTTDTVNTDSAKALAKGNKVPLNIAKQFDPEFVDLPEPPKLQEDDYVSACLLIKDDNHWLIEWLAYHYFALPLKELVVVIDPDSKTSPKRILNRWTSRKLMNITIWEDKDFMPDKVTANAKFFDNNTEVMMHRVRQTNFIKKCIPALRSNHAKWTLLIDTDEFVIPSYGSWYFLNVTSQIPQSEPGNVLRMLKYHEQITHTNNTCVYMPRFFYGAKEDPQALAKKFVPKYIDPKSFLTQRFLYRDPRQNPNGKNLINLNKVTNLRRFESVHKITSVCPDVKDMWGINQQHNAIVRVQHYLGTTEQHLFRDDPRTQKHTTHSAGKKRQKKKIPRAYVVRGLERYKKLDAMANHRDDGMMGWVGGFVRQVGKETALELLQGVGQVGVE